MKKKDLIFKLALTAVFSALCFALTYVSIPLPTGAKVHLGNFACVLAGLLCGGIVGGVAGSLGMGLNDIAEGYEWSTFVRTFIVKFLLGFIVGSLFRIIIKKDKAAATTLYALAGLFVTGTIGTIVAYTTGKEVVKDGVVTEGVRAHSITIGETTKTVSFSVLVPIFTAIFAAILIGVVVMTIVLKLKKNKKGRIYTAVATVTAISVVVNTLLEFLLRWIIKGFLVGSAAALAESITKLPSNIITGVVTIVAVTIVYLPVYYAVKAAGYQKYIIHADDNDDTAIEAEEAE